MKEKVKGMIVGLLLGTAITGGTVWAATGAKTIEVLYNNIKVYKDNVLCELKDANGTVIEPFIYNGTTYMPVRGTANIADMEVTWDGATQSVYLWDEMVPEGTNLLDVCPPYETSGYADFMPQSGKHFFMAGEKYSNGFVLKYGGSYAMFNLNSRFSNIEMTLGREDDYGIEEQVIYFYVDGKLVKEITIGAEELPKKVSIPVNYGLQLKIVKGQGGARAGFANITVH